MWGWFVHQQASQILSFLRVYLENAIIWKVTNKRKANRLATSGLSATQDPDQNPPDAFDDVWTTARRSLLGSRQSSVWQLVFMKDIHFLFDSFCCCSLSFTLRGGCYIVPLFFSFNRLFPRSSVHISGKFIFLSFLSSYLQSVILSSPSRWFSSWYDFVSIKRKEAQSTRERDFEEIPKTNDNLMQMFVLLFRHKYLRLTFSFRWKSVDELISAEELAPIQLIDYNSIWFLLNPLLLIHHRPTINCYQVCYQIIHLSLTTSTLISRSKCCERFGWSKWSISSIFTRSIDYERYFIWGR